MVDVKIDLAKKTKAEIMALIRDLTYYAHIISIDDEIAGFRKKVRNMDRRSEDNTQYAINEFNNAIVKYCEGDYRSSMEELRDRYEGFE